MAASSARGSEPTLSGDSPHPCILPGVPENVLKAFERETLSKCRGVAEGEEEEKALLCQYTNVHATLNENSEVHLQHCIITHPFFKKRIVEPPKKQKGKRKIVELETDG